MHPTTLHPRTLSAPASTGARRLVDALFELPWSVFETLCRWQARVESRRHLAELDDRMLADVGLSRADVAPEVAKSFWQD